MAQHKQSEKRARQDRRKELRNTHLRSLLANALKKIRSLNVKTEASKQLAHVFSIIDKSAAKNIIHRNTAARYKSRISLFMDTLK